MKKLLPAVLLVLVGCASGGAVDTTPPVAAPVTTDNADLQKSLTELLERIDVLNDRIARLEAAQEAPAPRVLRVEERPAAGTAAAPQTQKTQRQIQPAVIAAQITESYRNALVLYGQSKLPQARAAFQQVFNADPTGELADNALYWIGETYFAANDFANAMTYYRRVTDEFGDQNKAPDAMYKLALTQEKTGDLVLARTTLQQVIARYPYSTPAASAKAELNRIKY